MKSINSASRESGVSIETIRYYERTGIVPQIHRAANGRREFSDGDIAKLRFIKRFRNLGFSISDIKNLQVLAFAEGNSCAEAASIARENLDAVNVKIAELTGIAAALSDLVAQCETNPETCPMIKELQDR